MKPVIEQSIIFFQLEMESVMEVPTIPKSVDLMGVTVKPVIQKSTIFFCLEMESVMEVPTIPKNVDLMGVTVRTSTQIIPIVM